MSRREPLLVREQEIIADTVTRTLASHGAAPVVLLLHGYTDSADTWRPVLEHLSVRRRAAVAVDLPGHGVAGPTSGPSSLAAFDSFVAATVQRVDNGAGVVIVGNSLGALLAIRAAQHQVPDLIGVLALAPPGSVINPLLRALPFVGSAISRLLAVLPVPEAVLRAVAGWAYVVTCSGAKASARSRRDYAAHLSRTRMRQLVELGARIMPEIVDAPAFVPLALPATLWWGTRDVVCPARGATAFAGIGHTVTTRGAPHCPQLADPELVLSLLDDLEARAIEHIDCTTQPGSA